MPVDLNVLRNDVELFVQSQSNATHKIIIGTAYDIQMPHVDIHCTYCPCRVHVYAGEEGS